MSADVLVWLDEDSLDHRRRTRNAMLVSLAIHGMVVAAFAVSPPATVPPLIEVLSVDLVAAAPASRSHARPEPAPSAPPAPAETPPPAPPEPAPPPLAKAPVQVLPEETPGRIRKVKPKPKPKVVAKIKPEPKPAPRRPTREEPLSLEDAMASLNDELGVDETADLLKPAVAPTEDSSGEAEPGEATSRPGAIVSPELAAWNRATLRLIKSRWVMPSNLRGRGLSTILELRLAASGDLIGRPLVVRSSGNPFFDDNAVRALLTAAPLPPVPKPGTRNFNFRSEAD